MKVSVARKFFLILWIMLLSVAVFPQQNKYSIDNHSPKERHHRISLRRLFHPDKAGKAARKARKKDDRKKKKHLKEYKKARKKYWKVYNSGKEEKQEGGKKVYRRMKKHKRKAIRESRGKNPDPWYKRIFKKKRKLGKSKE